MNEEPKDGNKEPKNILNRLPLAVASMFVGVIVPYLIDYFVFKRNDVNVPETQEVRQIIAQQYIIQNVFLGILILVLLGIGACVYVLVKRSNPSPHYKYYTYENPSERDMMHKRVIDIIEGATRSIVAVNAWREEEPPKQSHTQFGLPTYREQYFQALIEASHNVPYTRLVQVDRGRKIATEFDDCYIDHFNRMLQEKRTRGGRAPQISLFSIEPVVPTTFVIVDDQYLLWQLNEVGPTRREDRHKRFWMRAVVIVDGGEFVKHFKDTFDKALANPKEEIKHDDLIKN